MGLYLKKEGLSSVPDEGPSFLIAAGGNEPDISRLAAIILPNSKPVIAADGGWRLCQELGLQVELLIGDFDTLSPEEVLLAQAKGASLQRYSQNKNESDLELAILAAHKQKASEATIIGALGGQWDHCLANLLAPLSLCHALNIWASLLTSTAEIYLLSQGIYRLEAPPQTRVSLAALSKKVNGLSLSGFHYSASELTLSRQETRGLANQVLSETAAIKFTSGELLITILNPSSK